VTVSRTRPSPFKPVRSGDLEQAHVFYRRAIDALASAKIPILVGGAYALTHYSGIERDTKDLDLFILPEDFERVLKTLDAAGFQTELTFPHWLGKVIGDHQEVIDIIFNSGNGVCKVDAQWFEFSVPKFILGRDLLLCPAEEMIWSKAYIFERDRFDGADIAHIFRAYARQLDWERLIERFGGHWRVLLSHLVLFGFVYPDFRSNIPNAVIDELLGRLLHEAE